MARKTQKSKLIRPGSEMRANRPWEKLPTSSGDCAEYAERNMEIDMTCDMGRRAEEETTHLKEKKRSRS